MNTPPISINNATFCERAGPAQVSPVVSGLALPRCPPTVSGLALPRCPPNASQEASLGTLIPLVLWPHWACPWFHLWCLDWPCPGVCIRSGLALPRGLKTFKVWQTFKSISAIRGDSWHGGRPQAAGCLCVSCTDTSGTVVQCYSMEWSLNVEGANQSLPRLMGGITPRRQNSHSDQWHWQKSILYTSPNAFKQLAKHCPMCTVELMAKHCRTLNPF